jgi:hypothetical protein
MGHSFVFLYIGCKKLFFPQSSPIAAAKEACREREGGQLIFIPKWSGYLTFRDGRCRASANFLEASAEQDGKGGAASTI